MNDSKSITDILIERSKKTVVFSIKTQQEGLLEFAHFMAWRDIALSSISTDIENMENELFAKNVMKFSLCKYKDIIIDINSYDKDNLIFDKIELEVSKNELSEFAEKFLEENDYLLYENCSVVENDKDDSKSSEEFIDHDIDNRKQIFEFPEDPLEKLKLAFIYQYKRQRELTEKILGLKVPKQFKYMQSIIEQNMKMNDIFKVKDTISPKLDVYKQQNNIFDDLKYTAESNKKILEKSTTQKKDITKFNDMLKGQYKHKAELDESILQTPNLIETVIENQENIAYNIEKQVDRLISVQKLVSESNNTQLKASNLLLEDQLDLVRKQLDLEKDNIKSSDHKANIALWLSIGSLIITILFEAYQIFDSSKTSLKNFEKHDAIKDAILEGNESSKYAEDTINKLIKENEILKNKVNELENKDKQ